MREVKTGKPLFKQLEEKYKQEIEMPQLEQKKKQLEELRSLHKPLDRKEIQEHAMKYESIKQTKMEEIKRTREMSLQKERDNVVKYSHNADISLIEQSKLE